MSSAFWLRFLNSASSRFKASAKLRRKPGKPRTSGRLFIELLEDRTVPTTVTWMNAVSGDWDTGSNWIGGAVPMAGQDAVINFAGITVTHSSNVADAANSLTSMATLAFSSGSLSLANTSSVSNLTLSGGTLSPAGVLTISGSFAWTGGTLSGTAKTVVASSGTLALSNGSLDLNNVLENDGNATWNGNGNIQMANGTLNNVGSFAVTSASNVTVYGNSGTDAFVNTGTFDQQGSAITTFTNNGANMPFNNSSTGTVSVTNGTLSLTGGGAQTGPFAVTTGATLSLNGTQTIGAAITVSATSTLTVVGGTTTVTSPLTLAGTVALPGGTLTINAALAVGNLTISGGTLNGSAAVTVNGTFGWTTGTLADAGNTVVAATGTFALSGTGTVDLNAPLVLDGTATWINSVYIAMIGGTITNNGTFTANSAQQLEMYGNGGTDVFINNNTFNQQGSNVTLFTNSATNLAFNNAGMVNVSGGTLSLNSGGTHSGTFAVTAGATLSLNGTQAIGAAITVSATSTLTVVGGATTVTSPLTLAGTVALPGGTLTINAALAVGNLTISGGTLNGSGAVTVNGTLGWTTGTLADTSGTVVAATGTFALSGTGTVDLNAPLVLDGIATWINNVYVAMNGGTITNNGTFTANSAQQLEAYGNGGTNVFINNNNATFNQSGSGLTLFTSNNNGVAFNNAGTVTVSGGTLSLNSGGTHSGTFAVTGGATLSLNGTQAVGAAITVSATSTLTIVGGATTVTSPLTLAGTVALTAGTLTINAALAVANLTISGGTLNGSTAVTVNGTLGWTAGTIAESGNTVVAASGTFVLSGTSTVDLNAPLVLDGIATWVNNVYIAMNGGTITNNGIFTANSAQQLEMYGNGGTNVFINNGTFSQIGSALTLFTSSNTGVAFNNASTVNVSAGTLSLNTGGSHTGTFAVTGGATLSFNGAQSVGGAITVSATSMWTVVGGTTTVTTPLTIAGTLAISSGTFTANAAMSANILNLASATLSGNAIVTVSGTLSWTSGTIADTAKVLVPSAGTLALSGGGVLDLNGLLENDGTGVWVGSGNIQMTGGTFNNVGNFTINSVSNLTVYGNSGSDVFVNNGTFNQQGSATTTFTSNGANMPFNNAGTVNVTAGILSLATGGTETGPFAVTVGANLILNGTVSFSGPNALTFTGGGTVAIAGGTTTAATALTFAGTLLFESGTLNGSANVTVPGTLSWTSGTIADSAKVLVPSAGTLALSGNNTLDLLGVLENDGTGTWVGSGNIQMVGGTFNNVGTFAVNSTSNLTVYANSGTDAFINNGTFSQQGSGITAFTNNGANMPFNNNSTGAVNVTSGTLSLNSGGSDTGTYALTGTATVSLNGTQTVSGAITMSAATTLTIAGGQTTVTVPQTLGGTLTVPSGALSIDAAVAVANLTISGGTLNGSGTVTVNGTLSWTTGTIADTGNTVVAATGTLALSGTSTVDLNAPLVLDGTTTWINSVYIAMNGGTITNNGTFTANSAQQLESYGNGGTNVFINNGTFSQIGSALTLFTTNNSGVAFNNAGAVNVSGGTLNLSAGGSHMGTFAVTAGATLSFAGTQSVGGAITLSPTCTFAVVGGVTTVSTALTLAGTLSEQGATLFLNDPVSVNNLTIASGTIDGPGSVTVNGTLAWTAGTLALTGKTIVATTGTLVLSGTSTVDLNAQLELDGTANWINNVFVAMNAGTITNNGTFTATSSQTLEMYGNGGTNTFVNNGTFIQNGTGTTEFTTNSVDVTFTGGGTVMVLAGIFNLANQSLFTNTGSITVAAAAKLSLSGTYIQTVAGALSIQVGGNPTANQFGVVAVAGSATVAGTLNILLINGLEPVVGAVYPILTAAGSSGTFTTLTGVQFNWFTLFTVQYKPTVVNLVTGTFSNATDTHFALTVPTTATAGTPFSFTVTALDPFNNVATGYNSTVHFTTSDSLATPPADSTLTNGNGTFSITLKTAGSQTVTATDTTTPSVTNPSAAIIVSPTTAITLTVTANPNGITAGNNVNFTVTAKDTFNNTATGYTGTVRFTTTDGQAVLPPNSTLTSGVGIFGIALKTVGNQTLTAIDAVTSTILGISGTVTVSPAAATHFVITGTPNNVTAGTVVGFNVRAIDAFNNTATGYLGTVTFTTTDNQVPTPSNTTLTNGAGSFNLTFKTLGSQTVTATDTASSAITGTSNPVVVISGPAVAAHFAITAAPTTITAGSAVNFTVTALDGLNNAVPGYVGVVHFTTSDNAATPPVNSTLTAGVGTFSVVLKTAGMQTLMATDTTTSSITGVSPGITVNPQAAAAHFAVSAPTTSPAGNPLVINVTAQDQFNNATTGYTGTVLFTSSDGQAVFASSTATLTGGVGFLAAVLKTAGNQTITATDTTTGTINGSATITVTALAASHFVVTAPANAVTASPFNFTVKAVDPFNNLAAGFGGTVSFTSTDASASLPGNSILSAGQGTFSATLKTPGPQTVSAVDTASAGIAGTSNTIATLGLVVSSFTVTSTGFIAVFNKPFDPTQINLYDASGAYGPDDVLLTGPGLLQTSIHGSLLIDPTDQTITFVKTTVFTNPVNSFNPQTGVLAAGTYTVTFRSATNGFKDLLGAPLDGTASGNPAGSNYTTTFVVATTPAVVVGVPSFARGPGNTVTLPNNAAGVGIPVSISNGTGVTSGQFTLQYNSALLSITGATVNSGLTGATLTLAASSTPGNAVIDFSDTTALTAGTVRLGGLVATVPNSAAALYKRKALLHFSSVLVNGNAATGDDAVDVDAYFGDTNGDGQLSGGDAALISSVASNLGSNAATGVIGGFSAYPLADPVLLGDLGGSGSVNAAAVTLLNSYLSGTPRTQIPPVPTGLTIVTTGPDPSLSVGSADLSPHYAAPGSTVVVPVNIDTARPDGSTGMTEAILAVKFDPSLFTVSATDVNLGTLPLTPTPLPADGERGVDALSPLPADGERGRGEGKGWQLDVAINNQTGEIGIDLFGGTPIQSTAAGSLVTIDLQVRQDAPTGSTGLSLVSSVNPTGQRTFQTTVSDAQGAFTLHSALTALGSEPGTPVQATLGSGQWAGASGQAPVGSGQWAVGSEEEQIARPDATSSSLPTAHCPLPTIFAIDAAMIALTHSDLDYTDPDLPISDSTSAAPASRSASPNAQSPMLPGFVLDDWSATAGDGVTINLLFGGPDLDWLAVLA